jgi:magnesium transporter
MIQTFLYDAEGRDREVELTPEAVADLAPHHLLWVDVTAPDGAEIARLKALFRLSPQSIVALKRPATTFSLDNYGDYFHCDVPAVVRQPDGAPGLPRTAARARVDFIVAAQWLVTTHAEGPAFLKQFRDQDKAETLIGALTGPQLAASLLDWHLEAYLGALEDVETFVDGLDARILARPRVREALLGEVMIGRRYVSSLRRLLGPQRSVFYGVSRPDFSQIAGTEAAVHYAALERRFERTLDAVEHGRDLMQSSFDLFTTRTAETTNMLLRRLTFLSLLLVGLGALVSVFGMDYQPPYAKSHLAFWVVAGVLLAIAAGGLIFARSRKWI